MSLSSRGTDPAQIESNLAVNVRHYREKKGITQDELAELMTGFGFGWSQATVWKVEQQKRPVRLGEAQALAEALQVPLWSNLTADPEPFRHQVQIAEANTRAAAAYDKVKAATTEYLRTQMDLVVVIRDALDHGVDVDLRWRGSWLELPPERAAIEARLDWEDADDVRAERAYNTVERILAHLRDEGVESIFTPEDLTVDGPRADQAAATDAEQSAH